MIRRSAAHEFALLSEWRRPGDCFLEQSVFSDPQCEHRATRRNACSVLSGDVDNG